MFDACCLGLILHFTADQSHRDLQFSNLFGLYAEGVFGQDRNVGEFADFEGALVIFFKADP